MIGADDGQLEAGGDGVIGLDGISEADLDALQTIIDSVDRDVRFNRLEIECWDLTQQFPNGKAPYDWQQEFFAAGADCQRRGLIAANQVGKTSTAAREIAMHLTGRYPPWWIGRLYHRPVMVSCATDTNQNSRDITMGELLGEGATLDSAKLGTGTIPRDAIVAETISMRQAQIKGVVDSVQVRHSSGGVSTLYFKSYEQGREKFQGTKLDIVWLDEQPPEDIAGECEMRIISKKGMMIATFTPLKGRTGYVERFLKGRVSEGVFTLMVGWDRAPHIDEKSKREAIANMDPREIDARTKGIPTMGQGRVLQGLDLAALVDPAIRVEPWHRQLVGIDFGFDHPSATVLVSVDDRGCVCVLRAEKKSRQTAGMHAKRIREIAPGVVVSWPHDGLQREKSNSVPLMQHYRRAGLKMLPMSARYDDDRGGGQDVGPFVMDLRERARSGTLKIHPMAFAAIDQEAELWHYDKNSKIVAENDDILSAWRYAMMMIRYARIPETSPARAAGVSVVERAHAVGLDASEMATLLSRGGRSVRVVSGMEGDDRDVA